MNDDKIHFTHLSATSLSESPTKPPDDPRLLPLSPTTVLYLAVTTPHTDSYKLHGPVSKFAHLIPTITSIASDSPSALDKLEDMEYTAPDVWGERFKSPVYKTYGFRTMVVEGQRGTYAILQVLVEENARVRSVLPAPVYTVTQQGPVVHVFEGVGAKAKVVGAKGVAATSKLVSSFVQRTEAIDAARAAMEELVRDEAAVSRVEEWGKGRSGGVLFAIGVAKRWEVRVVCDVEGLGGGEGETRMGGGVAWA